MDHEEDIERFTEALELLERLAAAAILKHSSM